MQKELIELGSREQRVLMDLYSQGVRDLNEEKSLSPRTNISDRLSWGCNEKKLKEYTATTLKRICVSMKSLKAKSFSTNRPTCISEKFAKNSKKRCLSPSITKQPTSQNLDELLK